MDYCQNILRQVEALNKTHPEEKVEWDSYSNALIKAKRVAISFPPPLKIHSCNGLFSNGKSQSKTNESKVIINCKLAKIFTEYSNGVCSDYFKFDMRQEGAEAKAKDERTREQKIVKGYPDSGMAI